MKRRRPDRPVCQPSSAFAGFQFPPEVILLAIRWSLRYGLSYRDLEELGVEARPGLTVPAAFDDLARAL